MHFLGIRWLAGSGEAFDGRNFIWSLICNFACAPGILAELTKQPVKMTRLDPGQDYHKMFFVEQGTVVYTLMQ